VEFVELVELEAAEAVEETVPLAAPPELEATAVFEATTEVVAACTEEVVPPPPADEVVLDTWAATTPLSRQRASKQRPT
jgi:hypothetical protein